MKTWDIGDPVDAADINENFQRALPYGIADGSIAVAEPVFIENYNVQILEPTEDTYNFSASPTTNFGTDGYVQTGGAGGSWQGLLKFDFANMPSAANLIAAYLLLSFERMGDSGNANIKRVTSTWAELTSTWNTRPSVTATNQATVNQDEYGNSKMGHYALSVLALVTDILNNTNYGFEVTTSGASGNHRFNSREDAAALRPRLIAWGLNPNAGKFKKLTDITSPEQRAGFIGFALVNAGNGDPVYVQREGKCGGFSSLVAGKRYYVQAGGSIGLTPTAILAGVAISSTELFVERAKESLIAQVSLNGGAGTSRTARNQVPFLPFADMCYVEHSEASPSVLTTNAWLDQFGVLGSPSAAYSKNNAGILQDQASASDQDLTSIFNFYKSA